MRHTELLKIYQAADLLLATSLSETQGLTVVEAYALGLPVVCADPALAWFGDLPMPGVLVAKTAGSDDIAYASIRALNELPAKQGRTEQHHRYLALSSRSHGEKLVELYEELRRNHKENRVVPISVSH